MIKAKLSRRLGQIWGTPEMYDMGEDFKDKLRSSAEKNETFGKLPKFYQKKIKEIEKLVKERRGD